MKNFRNQRPQGVNVNVNQEDKENAGYENFDNANVSASLLMLFHYITAARKTDYKRFKSFQKVPPQLVFNFCLHTSKTTYRRVYR
jgi:hypothetical protein